MESNSISFFRIEGDKKEYSIKNIFKSEIKRIIIFEDSSIDVKVFYY